MLRGIKYVALLPLLMAVGTAVSGRVPLSCSPGPFILFFGHRSVKLNERSRWVLDNAVEQRGDCGEVRALVVGYSDTSEPRLFSRKRAEAARNYMAGHGMPVANLTIRWKGSEKPRVPTPPDTAEEQNRRVEIMYSPPEYYGSPSK
jgi:outer membrane protein OmpA-like peptidoglycan-associated protein